MVILALDTTARAGSLALWRDGRVEAVLVGDASRTHGERLPGDVRALLSRAGIGIADVDLYAVLVGPGSFTGLRVGIAAVQGLAFAQARRVVGVPALEACAMADEAGDGIVGVWIDAQRGQVFAAAYERRAASLTTVSEPVARAPQEVVALWRGQAFAVDVLIGDGLDRYSEIARRAWPGARLVAPAPPLAPIAARLAAARADQAVAPHALVPIYVRPPDAELARRARR